MKTIISSQGLSNTNETRESITLNDDSNLQKLEPGEEVSDVTAQRLEARVGALGPLIWDFPHQQVAGNGLQISIHDHQAFDGLEEVLEAQSDGAQQPRKEAALFRDSLMLAYYLICDQRDVPISTKQ